MKVGGYLQIGSAGTLQYSSGTPSPSGTANLAYNGYLYPVRCYNAVYNDYADFQKVDDVVVYGKVYRETLTGLKICDTLCQLGVVGIASDTYGQAVGTQDGGAPIAVGGWVLAYVDKQYEPGTPLMNDAEGNLVEMDTLHKTTYPERIVATYARPEPEEVLHFPGSDIQVKGRHWVKVR